MRILLDTHYLLWATVFADRLTRAERALIEAGDILVSAVSLWELRIKWQTRNRHGERKGPVDPAGLLTTARALGWEVVPLDADQATRSLSVPVAHRDPFDIRLLIQAQELGVKLLTRDGELTGHPLVLSIS